MSVADPIAAAEVPLNEFTLSLQNADDSEQATRILEDLIVSNMLNRSALHCYSVSPSYLSDT